ncbi:MAG: O-antigen ligase family protein [Acidiferrobacteraceae bacterium]
MDARVGLSIRPPTSFGIRLTLYLWFTPKSMRKITSALRHLGVNDFPTQSLLDSFLFLLSALLPVGYLTIRNPDLLGIFGTLMLLASVIVLWREDSVGRNILEIKKLPLILLAMALPTVAVLIAGSLRLDFHLRAIDGPSRMLLVIPILFALYIRRIDFSRALSLALPLGLVAIFVYAISHHHGFGHRLTVKHMNPILWGDSSMVLGFMCLYSIRSTDSMAKRVYLLIGLVMGVLMSVLSQSRGGWVAGLALLLIWGWLHRKSIRPRWFVIDAAACVITIIGLYLVSGIVHKRIDAAFNGVYGWITGRDIQTPTGYRLTMWRIGFYLFMKHPLLGYGDHGLKPYLNDPRIRSFADPVAIHGIQCCGPHNEIIAQLLRSGIFGILSLAGTYIIPIYYFWNIRCKPGNVSVAASQAISLIIGFFVSALTIEMLTLKVAWTFYALFMAGLIANVAWQQNTKS